MGSYNMCAGFSWGGGRKLLKSVSCPTRTYFAMYQERFFSLSVRDICSVVGGNERRSYKMIMQMQYMVQMH